MSNKTIGVVLIILGVELLVVSLLADVIGIGNGAGFGWKQTLGSVVGALVAVGGGWLGWGKAGKKNQGPPILQKSHLHTKNTKEHEGEK